MEKITITIASRITTFTPIILILFFITACGGGGGSKTSGTPPPDSSINGSAVKGIIKNATVEVFAIENGSASTQPIATTTTDSQGHYSFTLSGTYSGPVLVKLRDNGDSTNPSQMTCDVQPACGTIPFGSDMPLGDIELSTVIANVTGGSAITAAVTPFTHMASLYAQLLPGGLTADSIASANSKVGNMLSINNIVATIPPDITNAAAVASYNATKYAYLSSAIASLATQSYSGNVSAAITALVNTYNNNSGELISSESVDSSDVISLDELAAHAWAQANANGADGQIQNAFESLQWLAQSTVDQPTTTTPSPGTGLGDLELVKDFVADVRTWGNVIDEEVQTNNSAFQDKLDMAQTTFDLASPLFTEAFDHAMGAALEAYATGTNISLSTYFSPADPVNPVTALGEITVTDTTTSTTILFDGTINGIQMNFTLDAPLLDGSGNIVGTDFVFAISNVLAQDASLVVTAANGSLTLSYNEPVDLTPWMNGTYTTSFPDPESGSLVLNNGAITEANSADPISFSGSLQVSILGSRGTEGSATAVRDAAGDVIQYNPASISFTGELGNSTNSIQGHIVATMENADTFMPIGPMVGDIKASLASYAFSNGGNSLAVTFPGYVKTFDYDPIAQLVTITDSYALYGTWSFVLPLTYFTFNDYLISNEYDIREFYLWVDGEGEYVVSAPTVWDLAGGTLDGVLRVRDSNAPDEDINNFRQITDITVTFSAQLEGLPEAQFSLTGDRTGFESGNGIMTIAYGGRRIEVTAAVINGDGTGEILITSQDGVEVSITRSDTSTNGAVMYNGVKYAEIETVKGITIIRYIDGYFESL